MNLTEKEAVQAAMATISTACGPRARQVSYLSDLLVQLQLKMLFPDAYAAQPRSLVMQSQPEQSVNAERQRLNWRAAMAWRTAEATGLPIEQGHNQGRLPSLPRCMSRSWEWQWRRPPRSTTVHLTANQCLAAAAAAFAADSAVLQAADLGSTVQRLQRQRQRRWQRRPNPDPLTDRFAS